MGCDMEDGGVCIGILTRLLWGTETSVEEGGGEWKPRV